MGYSIAVLYRVKASHLVMHCNTVHYYETFTVEYTTVFHTCTRCKILFRMVCPVFSSAFASFSFGCLYISTLPATVARASVCKVN